MYPSDYDTNRCNGCGLERLKKKHGEQLIKVGDSWYLKGKEPYEEQSKPYEFEDDPIRFVSWFMSEEHCCGR